MQHIESAGLSDALVIRCDMCSAARCAHLARPLRTVYSGVMLKSSKRARRNGLIASLHADGWSDTRIASRGDMSGMSTAGIRKVLQRGAPRDDGAHLGRRTPDASPAPDATTMIECPRCRRQHPARRDQDPCACGWQFVIFRRSSGPRFAPTSRYFELDHHGMPVETIGPGVY